MDPTIFGLYRLVWEWYNWGVFVAFVLALVTVFWVFFDSQRRRQEAILWKVIAVVSLILIVPSVILRIDPSLGYNVPGAIAPLGYLGLLAGVAALVTLFAYILGVGVKPEQVCPTCGQPQDPSWDHCPYCVPSVTQQSPPPPFPIQDPLPPTPVSVPSVLPTERAVGPTPLPAEQAPAGPAPGHTEILRKPPEKLAWLILRTGPRAGQEFPLGQVTNVGRDAAQSDIVVDDPSVSRQHARLRLENGRFVLYDLASANGTSVNGQAIQKQPLRDGDKILFGQAEFTYIEIKS